MNDVPAVNTDRELWRKVPGDYYSPSVFVTENGSIGINVGGLVLVAYVEAWFNAGKVTWCVEPPNKACSGRGLCPECNAPDFDSIVCEKCGYPHEE